LILLVDATAVKILLVVHFLLLYIPEKKNLEKDNRSLILTRRDTSSTFTNFNFLPDD
jgi:hypothetical protein